MRELKIGDKVTVQGVIKEIIINEESTFYKVVVNAKDYTMFDTVIVSEKEIVK